MSRTYPYPPGKSLVKWVSPDWLDQHLKDDDLMILDIQPNVHDYIMGHIPGAIYMNEGLLRVNRGGQPAVFISPQTAQGLFSRLGLQPDRKVLVYTGAGPYSKCAAGLGDGLEQTMVAYALARFGHERILLLDGGIEGWLGARKKLTKVFPRTEVSDFPVILRREYFVEYEDFLDLKDREDTILFDARPTPSYEGQAMWIKPGHIPGAHSLPWRSLMDDKNSRLMRADSDYQAILGRFPLRSDKTVIVYCGTGREATNEFVFFKWYLGHPKVKIYEGSFTEWSSYPDNPTVTGPSPR